MCCKSQPETEELFGGENRSNTSHSQTNIMQNYAEKDATVLYQQLTKGVLGPGETALDFLVLVLDLCQKVF